MDYKKYIRSNEWEKKRQSFILNKKGICEICSKKGNHLHHRTYENLGNEKEGDLILLCGDCHKKIHFKGNYKYGLKKEILIDREEEIKKIKSLDIIYKKKREIRNNLIKKHKLIEGKKNINLHQNIGNKFIEKFGIEVFLDFLNIYKETKNITEIFEIYGIEIDKQMKSSFSGVIGNANTYGLSVDDIIDYVLKYRFIKKM